MTYEKDFRRGSVKVTVNTSVPEDQRRAAVCELLGFALVEARKLKGVQ